MDIYLVRKGASAVALVTFSKRRAIARAAKLANKALDEGNERLKKYNQSANRHYHLIKKTLGSDAKVWCSVLMIKSIDGTDTWSGSYWVQKHQLHDAPLDMLAAEAE